MNAHSSLCTVDVPNIGTQYFPGLELPLLWGSNLFISQSFPINPPQLPTTHPHSIAKSRCSVQVSHIKRMKAYIEFTQMFIVFHVHFVYWFGSSQIINCYFRFCVVVLLFLTQSSIYMLKKLLCVRFFKFSPQFWTSRLYLPSYKSFQILQLCWIWLHAGFFIEKIIPKPAVLKHCGFRTPIHSSKLLRDPGTIFKYGFCQHLLH